MLRRMIIVLAAAALPALYLTVAAQSAPVEKHPMVSVMPPDDSLPPPPVPAFPDCTNACVIRNGDLVPRTGEASSKTDAQSRGTNKSVGEEARPIPGPK